MPPELVGTAAASLGGGKGAAAKKPGAPAAKEPKGKKGKKGGKKGKGPPNIDGLPMAACWARLGERGLGALEETIQWADKETGLAVKAAAKEAAAAKAAAAKAEKEAAAKAKKAGGGKKDGAKKGGEARLSIGPIGGRV